LGNYQSLRKENENQSARISKENQKLGRNYLQKGAHSARFSKKRRNDLRNFPLKRL